jgi:hypothetical protein
MKTMRSLGWDRFALSRWIPSGMVPSYPVWTARNENRKTAKQLGTLSNRGGAGDAKTRNAGGGLEAKLSL